MGRPPVRLDELLGLDGLTLSELQSYLLTESHHSEKSQLVPVNLTWAIGFSWSSYIAQSVMTGCCLKTGLDIHSLLADHTQVPTEMGEVVAVATDDVMHFSNVGPSIGEQWMERLDTVFESVGVITNASKDISGTKNATCVGIDMHADICAADSPTPSSSGSSMSPAHPMPALRHDHVHRHV